MRCAIERYNMIENGDRIAVAVSGGKDSVALLDALGEMRRFLGKEYELEAVTLDPRFNEKSTDFSEITELCNRLGIRHTVKRTDMMKIIFDDRKESNPCSLCARMRRGILHDMAKELNCNKIALGHHQDDAAETFIMNLFLGGRISCFSPVSYLSRKDLHMIRPMIFATEKDVESAVRHRNLPIVKSPCPMDKITYRQKTKNLLSELEEEYPLLRKKITGALQRDHIDRW